MPASTMEVVEPQSLKKLSLNSVKRALDLFSPFHGHFPPSDPDSFNFSRRIRVSHKLNVECAGVEGSSIRSPQSNAKSAVQDQPSGLLNALALPGTESTRDQQKGAAQNELVVGPSVQPKSVTEAGFSGKILQLFHLKGICLLLL